MDSIGVRELKQHMGQILRRVREEGEQVQITYRGQVVAHLVPVSSPQVKPKDWTAVWSDLDRLAAEIGTRWPNGVTALDAVKESRREL